MNLRNTKKLVNNSSAVRFIITGGINTIVTYAVFFVLSFVLISQIAYTISYFLGILLSYVLNTVFVFRSGFSAKKLFQFPMVYLIQYVYGVITLTIITDYFSISPRIAMIFVIITSIPLTYVLSRWILTRRN